MPTLIPLLLFSGYLIPYAQIPSYFKWLYHCSPFAYAMSALQVSKGLNGEVTPRAVFCVNPQSTSNSP